MRSSPKTSASPSGATAPLPKSAPLWLPRLSIGFIQGAALCLLLLAPDRGIWQSALSAALIPAAVAAPQPAPEAVPGPRVMLDIAPESPRPVAPKPPPPAAAAGRPAPPNTEPAGDIMMHTAGKFPAELLAQNWSRKDAAPCITQASIPCEAWFLDLDGDGRAEILLAYGDGPRVKARVMRHGRGRWMEAAAAASPPCPGLLSQVRRQRGGLLPGWRKALRAGLRQGPGAPPVELPCPRG